MPTMPYVALAVLLAQEAPDTLAGYWANPSESVIVLITPCAGAAWCGSVHWASDKAKADAGRRGTAALVGTELLHDFVQVGPNRWKGRLFVPDLNRRSAAELRLLDAARLQVRGCTVAGLICKTQTWTRSKLGESRSWE